MSQDMISFINIGSFLLILLIGTMSARRFNFLHGFILILTLLSTITGVIVLFEQYNFLGSNPDILNNINASCDLIKNTTQVLIEPLKKFIKLEGNLSILIYFVMLPIWFLSRMIAGVFQAGKRRK